MSEVRLTQAQVDRIVDAAIAHLDIATEEDRRTVRLALICAAKDPYAMHSLTEVFERMLKAVASELKVMNFELSGQSPPSAEMH